MTPEFIDCFRVECRQTWAHAAQKRAAFAMAYGSALSCLREADLQAAIDEEGCGAFIAAAMYPSGPAGGMVDTRDSKSLAARRASSSLAPGTSGPLPLSYYQKCALDGVVRLHKVGYRKNPTGEIAAEIGHPTHWVLPKLESLAKSGVLIKEGGGTRTSLWSLNLDFKRGVSLW